MKLYKCCIPFLSSEYLIFSHSVEHALSKADELFLVALKNLVEDDDFFYLDLDYCLDLIDDSSIRSTKIFIDCLFDSIHEGAFYHTSSFH